jgi:hypothetical protein
VASSNGQAESLSLQNGGSRARLMCDTSEKIVRDLLGGRKSWSDRLLACRAMIVRSLVELTG